MRHLLEYLEERDLLDRESLVDGDVVVARDSSRNEVFGIQRGRSASYFVKRIQEWQPEARATLRREASCYRLIQDESALASLRGLLPRFHLYDPVRHVLVLEHLPDAENVMLYHQRLGEFPAEIGAAVGTALGRHHAGRVKPEDLDIEPDLFPRQTPWILSFHEQHDTPYGISDGNRRLLAMLRSDAGLTTAIEALRDTWRPSTLIHADLKWENLVVFPREAPPAELELRLIDWELSDIGDPLWDTGAALQSYLAHWVFSIPGNADAPIETLAEQAEIPLDRMIPSIQAFWHAYAGTAGLDDEAATLERSVRYAAARMLQTAFERLVMAPAMTPNVVLLVQMSANLLQSDLAGMRSLLGLEATAQ